MNELKLWQAVIYNAVDGSLDMKHPGRQQEDIDWFYSDHYALLHKACFGVSGDSLRERLEPLWEDIELHPGNSNIYRRIFNPMGGDRGTETERPIETRSLAGQRRIGKKCNQPKDHKWQRERNEKGQWR